MSKLSRKKALLLFTCMLLMFVFIGVNTQITSNIAYITGGAMAKAVKVIPFIF
ncbi:MULTISPECIES: hypothetical protein [Clostridium]|uniref:hypothetical protein n=1 Tax=Clostridium TaxID=1485 RepID=UPI000AEDC43C|nr:MULTISPECIES: hypothetical protein [Clostridium]MCD2345079.1 hypothetical protein [Clostridium guangxiense]